MKVSWLGNYTWRLVLVYVCVCVCLCQCVAKRGHLTTLVRVAFPWRLFTRKCHPEFCHQPPWPFNMYSHRSPVHMTEPIYSPVYGWCNMNLLSSSMSHCLTSLLFLYICFQLPDSALLSSIQTERSQEEGLVPVSGATSDREFGASSADQLGQCSIRWQ